MVSVNAICRENDRELCTHHTVFEAQNSRSEDLALLFWISVCTVLQFTSLILDELILHKPRGC